MLLLSRGLLLSFRDLLERTGYDVRVVHTDALPALRVPIPNATPLVSAIAKLPEVQEVALVRRDRLTASTPGRPAVTVTLIAASEGADRRAWRLLTGAGLGVARAGADRPPLVVSERFANGLRVTAGSEVRLRAALRDPLSVAPPLTFRVVGVARFELEPDDSPL